MNFDKLYTLVNEIPHFTPRNFPGGGTYVPNDIEFSLTNNDIDAIDYRVELWEGVPFELKREIVNFLNQLADVGLYLTARHDEIFIFNANSNDVYSWDTSGEGSLLVNKIFEESFPENMEQSKFKIYFAENQKQFLYCSSKYDKCFTKKA